MKVGILGSGEVAKTLGSGFLKYDHEVMLGTRDVEKLLPWKRANMKGFIGTLAEAAEFGELLVLAVKGLAAAEALRLAGKFGPKVVIDTTNPIADAPRVNGRLQFFTTSDASLMEQLQKEFSSARFVKAFSCVGSKFMVNPDSKGVRPVMFICGNDAAAKKLVGDVLEQFGWEATDMGGVESARTIEPLCSL